MQGQRYNRQNKNTDIEIQRQIRRYRDRNGEVEIDMQRQGYIIWRVKDRYGDYKRQIWRDRDRYGEIEIYNMES